MHVETHGWIVDRSRPVPPRTFIELSEAEVLEAVRRYATDEGVDVPAGRPKLMTTDGAPRASGFMYVVEHVHQPTPMFDSQS